MKRMLRRNHDDLRRHVGLRVAGASVAAAVTLAMSGCGSDDDSTESSETTARTQAAHPDLEAYCARAAAYQEATTMDIIDVASILDEFEEAAEAARAVADAAPPEVRTAHEQLAGGAEELMAGLRARAPKTMEEFETASEEILADLTPKYGDLEAETAQVQSFATKECGLSFE